MADSDGTNPTPRRHRPNAGRGVALFRDVVPSIAGPGQAAAARLRAALASAGEVDFDGPRPPPA